MLGDCRPAQRFVADPTKEGLNASFAFAIVSGIQTTPDPVAALTLLRVTAQ
jgi:hypothetical protein